MVVVDGIDVEIVRKKVRCVRLHVRKDCSVTVSVPFHYSEEEVIKFISGNRDWIRKHQERIASKIVRYEDGEIIRILGEPAVLRISLGDGYSCRYENGIVSMTTDSDDRETKERILRMLHYRILARHLDEYVSKWELITGNRCSSYDMKYFKSRWGVCNVKDRSIRFNTELATKLPGCIEYVVLHEITHLDVPDHGTEFKRLMTERMPDWKFWEKKLKE